MGESIRIRWSSSVQLPASHGITEPIPLFGSVQALGSYTGLCHRYSHKLPDGKIRIQKEKSAK